MQHVNYRVNVNEMCRVKTTLPSFGFFPFRFISKTRALIRVIRKQIPETI